MLPHSDQFSESFILHTKCWPLEPIPAAFGQDVKYTLDESPDHSRADKQKQAADHTNIYTWGTVLLCH